MKTATPVNRVAFPELIQLFTKVSDHLYVLPEALGAGHAKIYDLEKGLQVRFWHFHLNREAELYNDTAPTGEDTFYTLAFFLSTEGIRFSYGDRYLPTHAIWDTLFFSSTAPNHMTMAAGVVGHCLGISFSRNWLQTHVFTQGECLQHLEEALRGPEPFCMYESMEASVRGQVAELMETTWKNALGSFYLTSCVLKLLCDFFYRIKERTLKDNNPSLQDKILQLQHYLDCNLTGPMPELKALGSQFSINQATLSRHFKKTYGVNISTYFMQKKLEYARKLQQEKGCSIKEVASLIGYANVYQLKAMLRKHLPSGIEDIGTP